MSKVQKGRENYERNRSQKEEQSNNRTNSEEAEQTHVHEFLASTKLAEEGDDRHNHRFAGVTSEVIPKGDSHVHVILTNTDFLDHHHEVGIQTGPAIPVGNGKHVHFVKGTTTLDDGHVHNLEFATLIDKPLV
ncbi:YmaF family protein [Bacillus sp. UNC41MFS5]|uniref:YmaF family protein n=1 Tax=Bacillus sp. UNC41MFS5 TaxID=1449046 RepID=UPI00047D2C6D|nr:YmaF family protein [Bacillus sp. UNC41MFS5]